jgi:hypothetical protein
MAGFFRPDEHDRRDGASGGVAGNTSDCSFGDLVDAPATRCASSWGSFVADRLRLRPCHAIHCELKIPSPNPPNAKRRSCSHFALDGAELMRANIHKTKYKGRAPKQSIVMSIY